MMTQTRQYSQLFDFGIDDLGLDQFATSVAAMADDATAPIMALEKALSTFADNLKTVYGDSTFTGEQLLLEKATAFGFKDIKEFRHRLERLIGERMIELHVSRLSASQRRVHTGNA